jgi:hypothetical protein
MLVKQFAQQTLEDECEYSETNKEDNKHNIQDEIDFQINGHPHNQRRTDYKFGQPF